MVAHETQKWAVGSLSPTDCSESTVTISVYEYIAFHLPFSSFYTLKIFLNDTFSIKSFEELFSNGHRELSADRNNWFSVSMFVVLHIHLPLANILTVTEEVLCCPAWHQSPQEKGFQKAGPAPVLRIGRPPLSSSQQTGLAEHLCTLPSLGSDSCQDGSRAQNCDSYCENSTL